MAVEMQKKSFAIETVENGDLSYKFDDDGRLKRTGTMITASAHIITAVIGSGVLSLAWSVAQLGWIAGIATLVTFAYITFFTSTLLADCYRSPDPITGKRNSNYMEVVKSNLGGLKYRLCGVAQYSILVGVAIGFTITSSISMAATKRSVCFHNNGHDVGCHTSNNKFMIIFGILEIILSQIPDFDKLSGLSVFAAVMSFSYSLIGIGLSISKIAGGEHVRTSLTGLTVGMEVEAKISNIVQAIGNIAFAFAFSPVLVEIQDTLKSSPPENKVMKKATLVGISVTTLFYTLCGALGYAAFGDQAPGNFLTGFGFYEPYWLVSFGNICIVAHLVGAYQVFTQPIYMLVENWSSNRWPESEFITREYCINIPFYGTYYLNGFRLVWRTVYVVVTTTMAMIFPFFNSVLGLLGAASFWPLTVYFPLEMYMKRAKIPRFSVTCVWLNILSGVCLIVSLLAAAGSILGIISSLLTFRPFTSVS